MQTPDPSEEVPPVAFETFRRLLVEQTEKGEAEYGMKLHTNNGRDPFDDALRELVDAFQYVVQARLEADPAICDAHTPADRRAAGCAACLRKMLGRLEWVSSSEYYEDHCPVCGHFLSERHAAECKLAALLGRGAGGGGE